MLTELKLPEYDRYTLQAAVDRMVLGLSLDGEGIRIDDQLLYGIEGITALQSATLSKLIIFMDALVQWRDLCIATDGDEQSYTASQWADHIRHLTENFVDVPLQELDRLNIWHQLIAGFEHGFIDAELKLSYAFVLSQLKQLHNLGGVR